MSKMDTEILSQHIKPIRTECKMKSKELAESIGVGLCDDADNTKFTGNRISNVNVITVNQDKSLGVKKSYNQIHH